MRMYAAVLETVKKRGPGSVVTDGHWMVAGVCVCRPSQPDPEGLADPCWAL